MSSLNGRRGQDTVAFIQELNMVHDPADEFLNFETDDNLDMFRNTTFVDESGASVDFQAFPPKSDDAQVSATSTVPLSATTSPIDNIHPYLDYSYDFTFPPQNIRFPEGLHNLPPIQPAPIETFPSITSEQQSQQPRQKQQSESQSPSYEESPVSLDGRVQKEADSDKRKRNTAASARFRVKKKLREQALEKKSKELEEHVSQLESKVSQLETENKWLKNLVMEKNEGKDEIITLLKNLDSKRAGQSSGAKPES